MTYAPRPLSRLASLWASHGGTNLGIVGDTRHQKTGTSYHLGRSNLRSDAYSRLTARDKAGLTEAASAIDLGRLDGKLTALRRFSQWLVEQAQANEPGTHDIREIIWSPDGKVVLRWDRQRGYASKPRPGEADTSHYTHTHVSFYRDSENREKTQLFERYWTDTPPGPDTSTKDNDMPTLTTYTPGSTIQIKATANIRTAPDLTAGSQKRISNGESHEIVGTVKGASDNGSTVWYVWWGTGPNAWLYTHASNVTKVTQPASGTTTPAYPDVRAELATVKTALQQAEEARVAAYAKIDTAAKTERERLAKAEADRIRAI